MKKLLIFLLAVVTFYGCQDVYVENPVENVPTTRAAVDSSDHYYWCDGVKIPLTVNENKLFVLVETAKFDSVSKFAVNTGGKLESSRTIEDHAALGISSSGKEAGIQKSLTSFTLDNANLKSIDTKEMVYVAPYFNTSDGADIGITNVFSVQLKGEQDLATLRKIAEENKLEILGENRFDTSIYYLSCTKESKGNALEMANFMYESGAFDYATPEFLIESMPAADPNDTYFSSQWNLKNNYYPGVDINYVNAISMTSATNMSNITVAVVDNGVFPHTDMPSLLGGYNAHTGRTPSGMYVGDHGTEVAGVVGAVANNNKGIAGVASGVKIMPVSICYTKNATTLGISASTITHFANAIRWAANNGAHVINNSWESQTSSPISEINNAITYAHGKGCVVVFASGNNNGSVSQPAAGAPAATLVVGAINQNGSRWYNSNYGSSLDVVAPGTGIWTTTKTGGYAVVEGTSYAAPHVSGIAALLLSAYPNLTRQQVETYIIQSANGYPYRNSEYGYGLVNAYKALTAPLAPSGQDRPMLNTNNNSSYTYTYTRPSSLPPGVTFNGWNTNSSFYTVVSGGGSGTSITIKFPNLGNFVLTTQYTINGTSYSFNKDLTPYYYPYFSEISPNCFRASADIPNVTFEWEILNGAGYFSNGTTRTSNPVYVSAYGSSFTLRCRAVQGGYNYSDWYEQTF